jgi:hypothetical protein
VVFSFIFLKPSRQQTKEAISMDGVVSNQELVKQMSQPVSELRDFDGEITEKDKRELTKAIASEPLSQKDILNNADIAFLVENQIIDENESKQLVGLEKLLSLTE